LTYVYLNSRMLPAQAAMVPVFDRGFAYGDALFETLKLTRGRPVFFREHYRRLMRGLREAGIETAIDHDGLLGQVLSLAEANQAHSGRLRIQVTRGTPPAPGGPEPLPGTEPVLLVTAEPFAGYPEAVYAEGIACRTVPFNRGRYARLKSTNLMGVILARQEAHAAGAQEAILTSGHGGMLEGSYSNIFFLQGGRLITAAGQNILAGVTRDKVLGLAESAGLEVELRAPQLKELSRHTTSPFLTSSVLGLCPVREIDGDGFSRDGRVAGLAARLAALEEASIEALAVP
jgi:branched-chain amino acid aminotransferase